MADEKLQQAIELLTSISSSSQSCSGSEEQVSGGDDGRQNRGGISRLT